MRLPPLAVGAVVGVAVAAALIPSTVAALRDLRTARLERATLAQLAAGPTPTRAILVDGAALVARDRGAAADALAAALRARAVSSGLLVEGATPVPYEGLARVRLRLSGSEDAVIAFADAVERGRPVIRFAEWRLQAAGGRVTLEAVAVSAWA